MIDISQEIELLERCAPLWPGLLQPAQHVLQSAFSNTNTVVHAPPAILNLGRVSHRDHLHIRMLEQSPHIRLALSPAADDRYPNVTVHRCLSHFARASALRPDRLRKYAPAHAASHRDRAYMCGLQRDIRQTLEEP